MSDRNQQLRRLRAGNFIANNGRVMRDINLLRHKHIDLRSVRRVEQDLCEQEFLDCINFLSQEGYIALRRIDTHEAVRLSDADYADMEAMVTGKGIRLLGGALQDEMVDV